MMKQTLQDLKNLQQRYDQETDKLIVENECSRYKIREIHEGYVTAVNKLGGICYTTTLPKPNIDKKSITWLDNLMKSLGQPEQQQKLAAIINTLHDDIIVQLKNNAPELTETDLQLYILLLSGFSPIIISKITGIKHIGVKKFRLIEKLLNHKPNSLSHYVNF